MKWVKDNLVTACDYLWRYLLFRGGNGRCACCGSGQLLQAHHLISRRFWRFRWKLLNGLVVCDLCHAWPARIMEWLRRNRPKQYAWVQRGLRSVRKGEKGERLDLDEVYESLMVQM